MSTRTYEQSFTDLEEEMTRHSAITDKLEKEEDRQFLRKIYSDRHVMLWAPSMSSGGKCPSQCWYAQQRDRIVRIPTYSTLPDVDTTTVGPFGANDAQLKLISTLESLSNEKKLLAQFNISGCLKIEMDGVDVVLYSKGRRYSRSN
jgi:hypothetical protein